MRELNIDESNLLSSDIVPFEFFLNINGLFSDKVRNKYDGITFHAESKEELGGANGITRINPETGKKVDIGILDSTIQNDRLRSNVCYHELGHALMGMSSYNSEDLDERIFKHLIELKKKYPNELTESINTYLSGCSCLEEYLVEKFAQLMQSMCKGINIPLKRSYSCPDICSDYKYYSSLESKYGIFETICDELAGKTFGDLTTVIRAGLEEGYFERFFSKFNDVEIMRILGNLGKVYQSIMNFSGHSRSEFVSYSPEDIKQALVETEQLVRTIKPRILKTNSQR